MVRRDFNPVVNCQILTSLVDKCFSDCRGRQLIAFLIVTKYYITSGNVLNRLGRSIGHGNGRVRQKTNRHDAGTLSNVAWWVALFTFTRTKVSTITLFGTRRSIVATDCRDLRDGRVDIDAHGGLAGIWLQADSCNQTANQKKPDQH